MPICLNKCNGCRSCELACSFHHTLAFEPSKSSIEIIPINNGYNGYKVHIYKESKNGRFSCDKCVEKGEPLCVKYCYLNFRDNLLELVNSL